VAGKSQGFPATKQELRIVIASASVYPENSSEFLWEAIYKNKRDRHAPSGLAMTNREEKNMIFRNSYTKQIYIKDYSYESGKISIKGLMGFFDYLFKIVVFTLLPIAVFTLITSKFSLFGMQSFVVLSGSMEPTLPVGSIVYSLKNTNYQVKDVISYQVPSGMTVTHRIMEIVEKPEGVFYRVKGDANNTVDSDLIPSQKVMGKAITLLPFLGFPVMGLKTLPGFIGFVIVPSLLFIVFELINIKKEIEKETMKKVMARMQIS